MGAYHQERSFKKSRLVLGESIKVKIVLVDPCTPKVMRGTHKVSRLALKGVRVECQGLFDGFCCCNPIVNRFFFPGTKIKIKTNHGVRRAMLDKIFGQGTVLGVFKATFLSLYFENTCRIIVKPPFTGNPVNEEDPPAVIVNYNMVNGVKIRSISTV